MIILFNLFNVDFIKMRVYYRLKLVLQFIDHIILKTCLKYYVLVVGIKHDAFFHVKFMLSNKKLKWDEMWALMISVEI